MIDMSKVNKKAFKEVCTTLEAGQPLTLEQVGSVFGQDFWVLLVYALMDSQLAARAIQGAINRLRSGSSVLESSDAEERS